VSHPRLILNIKGSIEGFESADADQPIIKLRDAIGPLGKWVHWGPHESEVGGPLLETVEQLADGFVRITQWRLPTDEHGGGS